MSVERFRPKVTNVQATAYCGAHPDGEYVKWSDCDAALARVKELEEALRGLLKFVEDECLPDSGQAMTDARAALSGARSGEET